MKPAILLSLALLLLFGCAGQQVPEKSQPQAADEAPVPPESGSGAGSETALQAEPALPLPDTSNLSFTREADDVMNTNTELPGVPDFEFPLTDDGKLVVHYFYSPYCVASKAIGPEIDRLEATYPGVEFRRYDIATQNGTWAYLDFADTFNLSKEKRLVPQVLVNGTILTDRFNINGSLEGIITGFPG
ncbi:MAG: thioredoxin family protein [Candidatus Micrarchaeota archaeon]